MENEKKSSAGKVFLVIVLLLVVWYFLFGCQITIPLEVTYTITTQP